MKTIAITVLLVSSFEAPKEWKLELPAADPEQAAEQVFHLSNAPDRILSFEEISLLGKFPRTGMRSVSVGDVIVVQDRENPDARHILTVAPCGFTRH